MIIVGHLQLKIFYSMLIFAAWIPVCTFAPRSLSLQGMGFATIRSCGDAAHLVGRQGCLTQATVLVHLGEKGTTFNTVCEKTPSVA